ncbi:MAG: 16S rRNA (cytosine(967)-C(5))-methyltransferase RsmB [Oleispira antarctica]|uniref:16S rRNA (cytosine(967)-C(5))-methyltransferase n=1 Tax=Oleispira antarctica RB-8 TaxID=698738 RepID=R4YPV8_OLEAN|nr:16S rRNA (cytosine(967)-C(5))-methyltransferase RsmB [Oleispira antarctica]MBQ0793308.1 16S rRNA (cytosine(967)-C(5))-methyltransferase RsmB [Oleispira antarctica]CCK74194.1 Ribosomal RNA small subunit methyltransferase B [Oleispira antarctica RB-8]
MSRSIQSPSSTSSAKNIRATAARVLTQVQYGQSLAQCLPAAEEKIEFDDIPFLRELCYGSCRWYFRLNALAKMLLEKPFQDHDEDLHQLLIIGLYQLDVQKKAAHAAIYETVEAAISLDKPYCKGVINACLRRYEREHVELNKSLGDNPVTLYSHPKWLVKALKKAWPDNYLDIMEANNQHPPFCIRVNQLHHSREEYLALLEQAGIPANAGKHAKHSIYLDHAMNVFELPGFEDGWCSVQDEAAQLAAELLDPQAGETVLDACAAPGGKTCHILESATDLNVTAIDLEEKRLVRVNENLERLNLEAKTIACDANDLDTWWDGKLFDRILLDAPCAAIGVIRRHPDIKLLRRKEDIEQLADVQLGLLKSLWSTLKPGGRLVYATCSIMPMENATVIDTFIQAQNDAYQDVLVYSLQDRSWGVESGQGRQLFPQLTKELDTGTEQGHDGFYYAVLEKKAKEN